MATVLAFMLLVLGAFFGGLILGVWLARQKPEEMRIMLLLNDEQKVGLSIAPVTKAGNPAKVDGVPVWTTSDETKVTLVVAEDGLSAQALSAGLGTAQVQVTADADLGVGVVELIGVIDIEVVPAQAFSLGVVAGTPELK